MNTESYNTRIRSGFTLVELSIVLVILGLLTGGILAGQSLIRASELRAVTSEYQRYTTAILAFRDKYFALPGDFAQATSFWGDDNAVCPDAAIPNGTPGTCNGNADSQIGWATETYRAWQHLANAGLVEGSYTGIYTNPAVLGVNTPPSKLANAGWTISTGPSGDFPTYHFPTTPATANKLTFGRISTWTTNTAIKPEELWNIDTKLDDGLPPLGLVRTYSTAYLGNCTTGTTNTATYLLTYGSVACSAIFIPGF